MEVKHKQPSWKKILAADVADYLYQFTEHIKNLHCLGNAENSDNFRH